MAQLYRKAFIFAVVLATAISASPLPSQNDEGLILMGATASKQFFITTTDITGDFTYSRAIGCPLRFNMNLAAIESSEEVAIIDNYFNATQGNSSDHAWTSGVARIGLIPPHWASTGQEITEFPAPIQGPWPSGGGSSPTYADYNCITIHRTCVRPPGTGVPGCFPAQTQFMYTPCDAQRRFICEKSVE